MSMVAENSVCVRVRGCKSAFERVGVSGRERERGRNSLNKLLQMKLKLFVKVSPVFKTFYLDNFWSFGEIRSMPKLIKTTIQIQIPRLTTVV